MVILKTEVAIVGEDGMAQTADRKDFERFAPSYGVSADALGKTFESRGETFRLTGLNPNRPKYPFNAERVRDGKSFKFGDSTIARKFADPKPEPKPSAGTAPTTAASKRTGLLM